MFQNSKAELTPLANLKLLMRVASETASLQQLQDKPSRRELFKGEEEEDEAAEEDERENVENRTAAGRRAAAEEGEGQSRLVIDDHDYSSDKSAVQVRKNGHGRSLPKTVLQLIFLFLSMFF